VVQLLNHAFVYMRYNNQGQMLMRIFGSIRRCWVDQYDPNFASLICSLGKRNKLTNVCIRYRRSHRLARTNFYTKVLKKIADDDIFDKLCCLDFYYSIMKKWYKMTIVCMPTIWHLRWLMYKDRECANNGSDKERSFLTIQEFKWITSGIYLTKWYANVLFKN